jgi:hypothetical protein
LFEDYFLQNCVNYVCKTDLESTFKEKEMKKENKRRGEGETQICRGNSERIKSRESVRERVRVSVCEREREREKGGILQRLKVLDH